MMTIDYYMAISIMLEHQDPRCVLPWDVELSLIEYLRKEKLIMGAEDDEG